MDARNCRIWCLMESHTASDRGTARHALEWICDSALTDAISAEEVAQIEQVRQRFSDIFTFKAILPDLCGPYGRPA